VIKDLKLFEGALSLSLSKIRASPFSSALATKSFTIARALTGSAVVLVSEISIFWLVPGSMVKLCLIGEILNPFADDGTCWSAALAIVGSNANSATPAVVNTIRKCLKIFISLLELLCSKP
jgi:hypothetical protein